jgi:hypothetical protein
VVLLGARVSTQQESLARLSGYGIPYAEMVVPFP